MNVSEILMFPPVPADLSLERLVLRCVLTEGLRVADFPLLRGLKPSEAMQAYVNGFGEEALASYPGTPIGYIPPFDEFDELFEMLWEYCERPDDMGRWLCSAIATSAQRNNHLWQDMGLPSRRELSAILNLRFPRLAAQNVHDMKWKKFFYRQLCQRSGVPICKSPSCADCCDYSFCFGPEH